MPIMATLNIFPFLLRGTAVTAEITAAAILLACAAAVMAAVCRLSTINWLTWTARVYIEFFRGTSALIQLFWVFYVLPFMGIRIGPMTAAILVLGLNGGAYGAEIIRGAVLSVSRGQLEAAIALNLPRVSRVVRIITPQALPLAIPPMTNLFIDILKNSSLAGLVTVGDLTFQAQVLRESTLRSGYIYGIVMVIYFLLAMVLSGVMRYVERRIDFPRGGRT